ncbi:hypothetical protein LCGC14_1777520, partial [marine sediment metagenome]
QRANKKIIVLMVKKTEEPPLPVMSFEAVTQLFIKNIGQKCCVSSCLSL